jgi:hypothetical protein
MADDRLIQRLEEQLADTHAANADLRSRLEQTEKEKDRFRAEANRALEWKLSMEKLAVRRKQAENLASAAQRKREDAERDATRLRGENDELRERNDRLQHEADVLNELNARIETAKHVHDLFPEG